MARRTKEEALETRNRILDAAEHVFFEKGVSHTTLADIAQHAGVTRGAIYWHFANKSELFDAMFDRVFLPIDELKATSDKPRADPLGRIRKILVWCLLGVARDSQLRRVFSILFMKCEYVADMEPLLQRNRAGMSEALHNLEGDLKQAVASGELPADLDTWRATLMLHSLVSGFVRDMLMLPDEIDAEQHAERLVDAVFDMLSLSPAMRRAPPPG
ncbi:TetR family transcriptional regulator [Burkholderia plantarii]|uniref:TetR family transcriptional regulator n=1 Tax=Burkholderia plantarii TaxID=41899 RepID=UPI0018DD739E|nr:TetR family transcriptional regulator [Burkholderia plantarii]MBI0327444.1 TetR family transcriptional regulator [Burkholderia plantarii]